MGFEDHTVAYSCQLLCHFPFGLWWRVVFVTIITTYYTYNVIAVSVLMSVHLSPASLTFSESLSVGLQ